MVRSFSFVPKPCSKGWRSDQVHASGRRRRIDEIARRVLLKVLLVFAVGNRTAGKEALGKIECCRCGSTLTRDVRLAHARCWPAGDVRCEKLMALCSAGSKLGTTAPICWMVAPPLPPPTAATATPAAGKPAAAIVPLTPTPLFTLEICAAAARYAANRTAGLGALQRRIRQHRSVAVDFQVQIVFNGQTPARPAPSGRDFRRESGSYSRLEFCSRMGGVSGAR